MAYRQLIKNYHLIVWRTHCWLKVFFSLRNIWRSEFLMWSERIEEWKNADGRIITGNTDGNCMDYMYFVDPWSRSNEWVKQKVAVILHWIYSFSIKDNIKHASVLNLRSIPFILSRQTWDAFELRWIRMRQTTVNAHRYFKWRGIVVLQTWREQNVNEGLPISWFGATLKDQDSHQRSVRFFFHVAFLSLWFPIHNWNVWCSNASTI